MPAPTDLAITLEEMPYGGRWVARTKDGPDSEMTFTVREDGVLVIDHTGVPPALEGRGIAGALMERAIEEAREKGLRIHPECSYVVAAFRRHPDWSDVLA
ncbi:MAG: acetyltransferase [Alphaproteobacteria bacterium]|nr:MAG: acetyltransferase [Caulobacteraceae bacterium]TPW08067.1 MAG: acetyltransferase [Alphaproteobacteria bacterium]